MANILDCPADPRVPGCHQDYKQIRTGSGTVVANASTLAGWVNIASVPLIGIWVRHTKGSLTSASVQASFAQSLEGTEYYYGAGSFADNDLSIELVTPGIYEWIMTGSANRIIPIMNPGAPWMAIYTTSVGTTTSSWMELYVSRNYGIANPIIIPDTNP